LPAEIERAGKIPDGEQNDWGNDRAEQKGSAAHFLAKFALRDKEYLFHGWFILKENK
jgi:hypothetical protein